MYGWVPIDGPIAQESNTQTMEVSFLKELSSSEKLQLLSKIMTEHQLLKARVKELEEQISRTSAEQVEIAQLKKRKLLMKDRMQILERN